MLSGGLFSLVPLQCKMRLLSACDVKAFSFLCRAMPSTELHIPPSQPQLEPPIATSLPSPRPRTAVTATELSCIKQDFAKLRSLSPRFPVVPSGGTRGNGHKLKHGEFHLNMRKNFFTLRVMEPWPRLAREAVESPSLEILKTRLDKVLCSLL